MLNYNHLHYFHVVATLGSIASAAQQLGITQPTVSEQVRALERTLGLKLFDRTSAGLALTDAGRVAYQHTSVMFRAGERLVELLAPERPALPHSLRVGVSSVVSRATTTDFLMPLFALDSCVPSIRSGEATALLRELRERELDLVLVEGQVADAVLTGLESVVVASTRLVAVAPPGVVAGTNWQDIGLVHYRSTSVFRWEVETFLAESSLTPRIVGEADDPTFLLESAIRGGYVTIVPHSIARDALRTQRVALVAEVAASRAGIHAVYQDSESAQLARRAVAVLVENARATAE